MAVSRCVLTAIAGAVRDATVVSAVAQVAGSSKTVRCNLREATASGNSNSMYYLADLANNAVPLLAGLSFAELEELRSKVTKAIEDDAGTEAVGAPSAGETITTPPTGEPAGVLPPPELGAAPAQDD